MEERTKPLYLGHRERLKQRFLKDGGASMADYEFLELLLTFAIPRRDVKDDAKKLIAHFGNFSNVLSAPEEKLVSYGLTQNTISLFKVVLAAFKRLTGAQLKETRNIVFTHMDYVVDYCKAAILESDVEEFHIMLLDKQLKLIEDKLISRGSVDQVPVYTRDVIKEILNTHATSVVLYHNHPSGNCSPSQDDIERTKEIIEALKPLHIKLYDHIIVSKSSYFSFHDQRLL